MQVGGRGRTSPPAWRKVFACDKNRRRLSARGSRRTNTCRLIRAAPPRAYASGGARPYEPPRLAEGLRVRQKPPPALRPGGVVDRHLPSDPGCPPASGGRGRTSPPAWRKVPGCDNNRHWLCLPTHLPPQFDTVSARGLKLNRETNTCRLTRTAPPRACASGGGEAVRAPPLGGRSFACDTNRRRLSAPKSRRTNTCRLTRTAPPREHMQAGGRGRTSPPAWRKVPGYDKNRSWHGLPAPSS